MAQGMTDSRVRALKARRGRLTLRMETDRNLTITAVGQKCGIHHSGNGARKFKTIGEWPIVSLIDACAARDEYRRKLWETGGVPFEISERSTLFADVAADRLAVYSSKVVEKTASIARGRLETYILPRIGNADIRSIKPPRSARCVERHPGQRNY